MGARCFDTSRGSGCSINKRQQRFYFDVTCLWFIKEVRTGASKFHRNRIRRLGLDFPSAQQKEELKTMREAEANQTMKTFESFEKIVGAFRKRENIPTLLPSTCCKRELGDQTALSSASTRWRRCFGFPRRSTSVFFFSTA